MSMNSGNDSAGARVLRSEGWEACVEARLLRSGDRWQESREFRSHGHALRRLFEDVGVDAVLCMEGRPAVCVLDAGPKIPAEVEVVRRQLWNLGATTLLMVENRHSIQVFSTLVKPSRNDVVGLSAQIADETINDLESIALALHLRQFIRRVETGAIYREHSALFDPKHAVDRDLLENLKGVRNLICPRKVLDDYQRAHALIGRFLFSCYLLDRGIIGPPYLKEVGLPETTDMLGLLGHALNKGAALEQLFDALQRDFNGSLFGTTLPSGSISSEEVGYFRRLLAGENLRTGQFALFKLYNFGFIPVELISSIYEEFLGAEAEAAAEARQNDKPRETGQRLQGAYYTPPRLAELAVDVATEGWDTLLDKRCLDPACGSGVFLVILFVRMAEEWRRFHPDATTYERYKGLLALLENNLRGVDIQLTACLVTCFSLYLAFLDQMEPKEVSELRETLKRHGREKLLPRILWERHSPMEGRHFDTVHEIDFFKLSVGHEFHLVIGNPPWVSRKSVPSVEDWLFSKEENPYIGLLGWTTRRTKPNSLDQKTLFPAKELACAFMWKAGLHLLPQGRVCQVLPSRVFLSNNTDRFQSKWLQQHRLEAVWLLADYRFILFPAADCPCIIARYHVRNETEQLGEFEFVTPKVELRDPRESLIPVMPEDQKVLSEASIIAAAEREEAAAEWKKQHWGTPRDARLIERLMGFPRLSRIAQSPPEDPDAVPTTRNHWWFKGQGFQPATDSTTDPDDVFWNEKDRFLSARARTRDLVLLRKDTRRIGKLHQDRGLHRKRSPLLFKAPLLLINKGCTKFLYSDFDVLFQDDFQSICAPVHEEQELLFLTAVFASSLAQYLLFHTTANIGIERDIVRLEEMLELPFPLPEDLPRPQEKRRIIEQCAECLLTLREDLSKKENFLRRISLVSTAKNSLNSLVFEYFGLSEWERYLVADTVKVFRPSATPGSTDSKKLYTTKQSTRDHRQSYADTLVRTFRGWSRTKKQFWASGYTAPRANLAIVTLGIGYRSKAYRESVMEQRVEEILASIRRLSAAENRSGFQCLRGFAYYEPDRVHILKPMNRRHWTRTAALNDADEILGRMMEEGGWGA